MKKLCCLLLVAAACGSKSSPATTTPDEPVPEVSPDAGVEPVETAPDAAPEPAEPDPAQVKAALLAAETAAYEAAKPVFEQYCASCHQQGKRGASKKKLDHFDMTAYPFGGHHAGEMSKEIREVLGIDGGKATMPKNKPGSVNGDDLALIAAWADAFDAAHEGGAHESHEGHGGHHH
jgi:hypothetical protein